MKRKSLVITGLLLSTIALSSCSSRFVVSKDEALKKVETFSDEDAKLAFDSGTLFLNYEHHSEILNGDSETEDGSKEIKFDINWIVILDKEDFENFSFFKELKNDIGFEEGTPWEFGNYSTIVYKIIDEELLIEANTRLEVKEYAFSEDDPNYKISILSTSSASATFNVYGLIKEMNWEFECEKTLKKVYDDNTEAVLSTKNKGKMSAKFEYNKREQKAQKVENEEVKENA